MTTLQELEQQCKELADTRQTLANAIGLYEDAKNEILDKHRPTILKAVDDVSKAKTALEMTVKANPNLFQKPKSQTFHAIRVGYAKGKGKIEYSDAANVVRLIKEKLSELAAKLIDTKETPIKKELESLTAKQMKSIGVTVSGGGDAAFVKAVDTDMDQLVKAFLDKS